MSRKTSHADVPKWRIAIFFYHRRADEVSADSLNLTGILDAYRASLSYLVGCTEFNEAAFQEFNRILGNRFSDEDIETQIRNVQLMIRGMEDLKQVLRSSTVFNISLLKLCNKREF